MIGRLFLGPGASGGVERLRPHADGLRARGIDVSLVTLPRGRAERAVAPYRAAVGDEIGLAAIGGHSFGGRVASLLAAEQTPAALVCFSYPLHAPGRHDAWDERTAHWPRIACPVLLLSGTADPFARLDLLEQAVTRLPDAELLTFAGQGHGLAAVLDEALEATAGFLRNLG